MKPSFKLVLLILALALCLSGYGALAAPLQVDITGDADGSVVVALFGTAADYDDRTNAVATRTVMLEGGRAATEFDLPPGDYAIAAFLDMNDNGELDTNLIGIPTEAFGFSGTGGGFGPPDFAAARISHPATAPVAIRLRAL